MNLAIAPSGDIYATDRIDNRIRRISFPREEILSPADLSFGLYAGLEIKGIVGRKYRIERSFDIGGTNWLPAATFILPQTPFLWFDVQRTNLNRQFYRAVLLP